MDIEQKLIERLEEFAKQLESGERINVTTAMRCGCDPKDPPTIGKGTVCHICNGRGFVVDSHTWKGSESDG